MDDIVKELRKLSRTVDSYETGDCEDIICIDGKSPETVKGSLDRAATEIEALRAALECADRLVGCVRGNYAEYYARELRDYDAARTALDAGRKGE